MIVIDNHQLEGVIAHGVTHEVWSATKTGPGGFSQPVVLKTLLRERLGSRAHVRAFINEARAASHVQHRNVVQTRDLLVEDGRYWLCMERVRGWSLRAVMSALERTRRVMPVEVAVAIVRDAASGLQAIHDAGLIHRNLTPDNLMMSASGHVVIIDFGCAAWQLPEQVRFTPPLAELERTFASPQMMSKEKVDVRTDVYSLGALLRHLVSAGPPVRDRKLDVPFALEGVMTRALAVDAQARFPSAREVEVVLEMISLRERWPTTPSYVSAYLNEVFLGAGAGTEPVARASRAAGGR